MTENFKQMTVMSLCLFFLLCDICPVSSHKHAMSEVPSRGRHFDCIKRNGELFSI